MDKLHQRWGLAKTNTKGGNGDWGAFKLPYETVLYAAEQWRAAVAGQDKLWLCWNINSDWCRLQQQLVSEIGWTPVVGWDPRCGDGRPSSILPSAIAVDFNQHLKLPTLFMHFPLEFAFLWCEKLAFWHSDLLLRHEQMAQCGKNFESLTDGEMAAVFSYGGLKNIFNIKQHRYFELLGCTTHSASQDQFEKGCGWWRRFAYHWMHPRMLPNSSDATAITKSMVLASAIGKSIVAAAFVH
jgi:hypothetical protein